jgi:hypothetical protein
MASNKWSVPSPAVVLPRAISRALERASAATARWRSRRWIIALTALTLLPFAMWLLGSGIVWATPATYRSMALLRAGADGASATEDLKSPAVMEHAARSLAESGGRNDPMATYSLWSSVTATPYAGPELVKLEARSGDAEEARRMVLAVAHAWRTTHRNTGTHAPALVYVDPPEADPQRVPDETRMILGLAGSATLCLLLCIPMLLFVERRVPVRRRAPVPATAPRPALLA